MRAKTRRRLEILMIGPLPPPFGGASVLFQAFVEDLSSHHELTVRLVETWKPRSSLRRKMKRVCKILYEMLRQVTQVDIIVFWASENGMLFFGPVVSLVSSLYRTPWILRKFGRGYSTPLDEMGTFQRVLTRMVFRTADLILLETRHAVEYFRGKLPCSKVAWHANYRRIQDSTSTTKSECRRFVFLGRVSKDKGILDILQAAQRFEQKDVEVDVYGYLDESITKSVFKDYEAVRYKGVIEPRYVPGTIAQYDALLLPTHYDREGYPGVILEAYAAGLPVVASNWPTIREIVDDSCGLLVESGSVEGLYEAMRKLKEQPEFYKQLAEGAIHKREQFSLDSGVRKFVKYCEFTVNGTLSIARK